MMRAFSSRLIVSVDFSSLMKQNICWPSMKELIHRVCLCIVSVDNVCSLICLVILVAIMSGTRNSRDSVRCEKLYNRMALLFPQHKDSLTSASILLSNIYTSLGDDDQAALIRSNRIRDHGNKVAPGMTWTEKDGEIVVKHLLQSSTDEIEDEIIVGVSSSRPFTSIVRSNLC